MRSHHGLPWRNRRFRVGLLLAALALSLAVIGYVRADGPEAGGAITGQVTASRGAMPYSLPGMAGVEVVAAPGGYRATTDRSGRFTLQVPPGVYDLTFSAEGCESYTQKVLAPAAAPAVLSVYLFPAPKAVPVAALKRGGRASSPGPVPYHTTVYLDASDSQHVSRQGIRWEVRDGKGQVVTDPYAVPARPLQLEPSPIPGSSPLEFTFTPPRPGRYTVQLRLRNSFSDSRESTAEVVVDAGNTPPEALPGLIAGPEPPVKTPTGQRKDGSGLPTVLAGDHVYLAGWALDQNAPSPELYNPGGRAPDAYGKNDDRLQRQFAWSWRLEQVGANGQRRDVTSLLTATGKEPAVHAQYPSFVAAEPGKYLATLTVADRDPSGSLVSAPQTLTITVLPREKGLAPEGACTVQGCHVSVGGEQTAGLTKLGGMPCQACHGPGAPHVAAQGVGAKRGTISVSYEAAQCGQCHAQYGEWEKSRHADGYPYGFHEVAQPLLLNCAKCHYPQGFADAMATAQAKQTDFGRVAFKKPLFPGGPLFFDFTKLPEQKGQGVACQACHDPHRLSAGNRAGLRAPQATLCGTCHAEKWQNVLLLGTAGKVGSAYEYPGERYAVKNPHDTPAKCVLCHLSTASEAKDQNGVRRLGGHTLRMRDAGPDGKLGGFGPAPEDPGQLRESGGRGADDLLNLEPCRKCHPDAATFDRNGRQTEIHALWTELGRLLKERNEGLLPGYKPGDKCATCHRGGTLPFDHDPHLVLENAYTNYKLVMNDRSWGIHNYQYTKKLLEDSVRAMKALP